MSDRRRIVVLDYGAGNVRSAVKALEHEGADAVLSSDPEEARAADLLVLPGQGHFGQCMRSLETRGLVDVIHDFVASGRPFLGICVGMQLLYEASEEAPGVAGLGLLRGQVRRIPTSLHLPHVGWNAVTFTPAGMEDPLLAGVASRELRYFYHVHSYAQLDHTAPEVLGVTTYGVTFATIAGRDNVRGVQFHPEKSQEYGLAILRNFARL